MGNYVKDNKNRYLLAFLSLLITRKVFEEVKLRFLIIGHKPKNIYGRFGYSLEKLKEQNNYMLAVLMNVFMGFTRVTLHFIIDTRDSKF
jgi:hypothetical protein